MFLLFVTKYKISNEHLLLVMCKPLTSLKLFLTALSFPTSYYFVNKRNMIDFFIMFIQREL